MFVLWVNGQLSLAWPNNLRKYLWAEVSLFAWYLVWAKNVGPLAYLERGHTCIDHIASNVYKDAYREKKKTCTYYMTSESIRARKRMRMVWKWGFSRWLLEFALKNMLVLFTKGYNHWEFIFEKKYYSLNWSFDPHILVPSFPWRIKRHLFRYKKIVILLSKLFFKKVPHPSKKKLCYSEEKKYKY